jgi:hypothetical protein
LLKRFHPRINLTTLFFNKTYLLNTIKPFLDHENLGAKTAKPQKTSLRWLPLGTFKIFKILGMQDINLAQMRPGAKISAF